MAIDSSHRTDSQPVTGVSTDGGDWSDLKALSDALEEVNVYGSFVAHRGRQALRILNPHYRNASLLVWVAESRSLRHIAKPQGLSFGTVDDIPGVVGEIRRHLQARM